MISITEAIAIIQTNIPAAKVETVPLAQAAGRYLADDILAPEPSPRYTNSAMDGYAVRWADVQGLTPERPRRLTIIGESRAGLPFTGEIDASQAVQISTGAMLPAGADTVIRIEDTEEEGEGVVINVAKRQGQDVRHRGEEFAQGELLLRQGTRIAAPQAALLASVGIDPVKVFAPCTVALLTTGSELMAASAGDIAEHQIRDSNTVMLQTAIQEAGAQLISCQRVTDDHEATVAAIAEAQGADLILCAGGVSVGRHDHVKAAAEANGFTPLFWRVRQKPGKPLYFARRGATLLFGLPGNPVSAFMCFTHYVRPLIRSLAGQPFAWPQVAAQAACDITNTDKRPNMVRVRWAKPQVMGNDEIESFDGQGSHMLTSLADADGYLILEPGQTVLAGNRIVMYQYDFGREPSKLP